jgi:myo-inositol-1(or 4)-monophosphatase
VFYLFVIWAFFAFAYVRAAQHEVTGFLLPVVLCYIVIGYLVFTKSYSFMKASRGFLSTHLYNCIVVPDKHVPFIEVLVADGLTSLSKVFFDFGVIGLTFYGMAMRGFDMDKMDVVGKAATFHLLPYLLWSVPYIIRANQCLICAKHTADAHARRNHYLNTMKYM